MKINKLLGGASLLMLSAVAMAGQKLTDPTAAEVAKSFSSPPSESCNSVTWGWNGPMTEEVITRDLDTLHARGLRIATIEAGYRMDNAPYLSEGWFKLIRFAAEQAKARGMRLIIIDEGKYPSGFVNGKYTRDRPELRMKALAQPQRIQAAAGTAFQQAATPETITPDRAQFRKRKNTTNRHCFGSNPIHRANRRAMAGRYRSLDFRHAGYARRSDPAQAKTKVNSMGDLIDKEAAHLFIEWTHEEYKKRMGDLFGNAILAFRGDEPEMTGVPWSPKLAEKFQEAKGYDIRPYLGFFGRGMQMNEEQRRAKADYFDVWSELFAENFFDAQADWCEANGVEATTHLNNDHNMPALVQTTGDFFRAMRKYQIPGVDTIWNQVWPGKTADFVRFPSSAAHLSGHPRALAESFAAYTPPPGIDEARFGVNYMLGRGINLFEFMFYSSSVARGGPATSPAGAARGRGYMGDSQFPALATYANRMTYALSQGKPAAQIGLYVPTMSMWLGDNSGNAGMLKIAQSLSENQRDFDFVDEQALSSSMKLQAGEFINASGQSYRAIIIPASTAISKASLDRLASFAKAGGKVLFVGKEPSMMVEKTFLHAQPIPDLNWATCRASTGEVTDKVLASLPKSDVAFAQACPAVKVMHRRWKDADVYFFFNESDQKQASVATVAGTGTAKLWNADSGTIENRPATSPAAGEVQMSLDFEPHGAKLIVVGAATSVANRN